MKNKIGIILTLTLVVALLLCSVSCGGDSEYEVGDDGYYTEETGSAEAPESSENIKNDTTEAKIIKNANVSAETKNYSKSTDDLKALIIKYEGQIANSTANESASYYNNGEMQRNAYYTVKIPSDKFDAFLGELSKLFNITNLQTSTEDVSESYFSLQSRISTLESKRAGLISMLENVDVNTDFDTWQKINAELTEIDVQLNYYNELLKDLDKKVSYSTVQLNVREVVTYTATEEKTYGDEIVEAFKGSFSAVGEFFKGLLIVLIYVAPFTVISGVIGLVVLAIVIASIKRRRAKRQKEQNKN